jgi:hypothetical protein
MHKPADVVHQAMKEPASNPPIGSGLPPLRLENVENHIEKLENRHDQP